jgi:hypothetical protein
MELLSDNPFAPILIACVLSALALAAVARLDDGPGPASLVAPAIFLVAYWESYRRVPAFPPVGATNKIFYAALIAGLLGIGLDLLAPRLPPRRARQVRGLALLLVPLLIALWIALPRFAAADGAFVTMLVALVLGGTLLLSRVAALATAALPDGGPMVATALLAVLAAVFAPIALFGGSSTSLGLCLGLCAGLGVAAVIALFAPRELGLTAILGTGGGLLAVIDTVTLITRQVDLLALAILLAVPFAGQVGARLLMPKGRPGPRLRGIAVSLLAASPIVVVLALLFLRHDNPF